MTVDTWVQAAPALVGAKGGAVAARSARRTKRQENRDDFLAVTEQQGKAIERLEKRIQHQETEAEKQRERISDQGEAIGWLLFRVRSLVTHIRKQGTDPPRPQSRCRSGPPGISVTSTPEEPSCLNRALWTVTSTNRPATYRASSDSASDPPPEPSYEGLFLEPDVPPEELTE